MVGLPPLTLETPAGPTWYNGNNQINTWGYDSAGNVTQVGSMTRSFTYDVENRQVTATVGGAQSSYAYDAEGRRVTKTAGGQTTVYVYDAFGQLVAEYGSTPNSGTIYLTADALGSTRLATTSSPTSGPVLVQNYDYRPFGEEIGAGWAGRDSTFSPDNYPSAPIDPSMRFTGKERDAETGLDYFGARYMSSAQGRFTSPDPLHILPQKLLDPQQWNMYSYVRNNPLRLVDPTGMYTTDCAQDDKACNKRIDKFEKARQKDLKSKNENVRNGANAYGARGDDNGVVVHVVTGQQMQQAIGVTANGAVVPTPGQDEDRIDVYINKDLGGKDLQRTVAHEGTHVGDDLPFINSFNPDTGMYNPALNITHGQTEFNAFTAGAAVKKYEYTNVQCGNGPCIFGPQDAAKINQFLHNSPTYGPVFNLPVFDPRIWRQQ